MKQKPFGCSGINVPVIGMGTWKTECDDKKEVIEAIQRGLDLGMVHLDTAELYGTGEVEEIVGKAIDQKREKVFLASKVLPYNATFEGTLKACERSLKRLCTDHLDLYLLHWRDGQSLEETFRAFEDLKRHGKIRMYGVSNFDVEDLKEAIAIVGEDKIACNQVLYHLKERSIEHKVIPFCEEHKIAVVGYSPFAQGHFWDSKPEGDKVLQKIAKSHRATPRQTALAFLTRKESLFTIPKASKIKHVEENCISVELKLSHEDIHEIKRVFPLGSFCGLPML